MKVVVQRFRAYAWPSGEVCLCTRGVWYGLGLYFERSCGLYAGRHGIIVPGASIVWRRYAESVPPTNMHPAGYPSTEGGRHV